MAFRWNRALRPQNTALRLVLRSGSPQFMRFHSANLLFKSQKPPKDGSDDPEHKPSSLHKIEKLEPQSEKNTDKKLDAKVKLDSVEEKSENIEANPGAKPEKPAKVRRSKPKTKPDVFLETNRRKSSMFNPKEYEDNGENEPPILASDKLLPLQLPFRPVYPGASTYMVSGDLKLMSALRKLNENPNWDHRVLAVMSKTPIKTTELVTSVDNVHSIGCVCLIDNISINKIPESDNYTAYAVLFPMFRARVGEIVQNININVSSEVDNGKVNAKVKQNEQVKDEAKAELDRKAESEAEAKVDTRTISKDGEHDTNLDTKQANEAATEATTEAASEAASEETKSKLRSKSDTFIEKNALDKLGVPCMRNVRAVPNDPYAVNDEEIQRLCVRIIDLLREISLSSGTAKRLVDEFSALVSQAHGGEFPQPDFLADFTASILPKSDSLQKILDETNVLERLKIVADLASKEVTYLRVQEGIARFGHSQTELRNREMILHEYLRYIKKELGLDGDDKSRSADKFSEKVSKLDMPDDIRRIFNEELNKFRSLETTSGEYNTVRTYLDWLSSLPWGKYTSDRFDLNEAKKLLDKSHYGMKDVKDRILEFLAVGKLNGTVDGKIVCLAGPPGVGKTSIAKSIAEALNRKFDRFSVGGLHDASEIKGHRRTYVAAMPGRIVQALKRTQTLNPVILIDEIDKLSNGGAHGSPSAALLEVLDPEQNKNFQDTYLEVPVDLSKVLFICTANYLEGIPAPLMDRMEVINVSGYLPQEKVMIASNHLGPKFQKEAGLGPAKVSIDREALDYLVQKYTREAGVRGLSKSLEKIFRKVAVNFVQTAANNSEAARKASESIESSGNSENVLKNDASDSSVKEGASSPADASDSVESKKPEEESNEANSSNGASVTGIHDEISNFALTITKNDLQQYVGAPVHNSNRLYDIFPPGVSMGLGWTPNGGMPLFIESVLQEPLSDKGKPRFTRTGQLGEVMNESTSIAYSFARMFMSRRFPRNHFLEHAVIHTHFPEGAIKKDGPSAGITVATSLISLAMDVPVNNNVAMTGELSLTGKVLQIGGLREKAVAAKTAGAKIIIFPEDNRAEWEELTDEVKQGLEPRPARYFQDVFDVVFGSVDNSKVNAAWPELAPKKPAPAVVNAI